MSEPEEPLQEVGISQDEVEGLLQSEERDSDQTAPVRGEETPRRTPKADSLSSKGDTDIQAFDFRQPVFLSTSGFRKLRLRHEEFIRGLTTRLSIYLRMEIGLELEDLKTVSFGGFVEELSSPTHLTLFKIAPCRGISLLDLPPTLGLALVDRLMGGSAIPAADNQELSEVEIALLDQVNQLIVDEWCQSWRRIQTMQPAIIGHENNARFLQTAPPDTTMLLVSLKIRVGELDETIRLAFPGYSLETVVRGLQVEANSATDSTAAPRASTIKWNPGFDDVRVRLSAEWPALSKTAGEVASLRIGDVIDLNPRSAERVVVRLAGKAKFTGRLGNRNDQWAVELIGEESPDA